MIYSAYIEMQTLSYEQAAEDIAALVERSGAYFEQKDFSSYSNGYRHASYTVRVPAEQFADFCAQVGTLCHVTWQSDSAEDISEQYYDTQSRLETAQIKLARLQELLKKAENMEDIITIESAISETEYEIERLSGTMRHYDALVDYATVTLELNEVYRLSGTEDAPKSFGEKLSNAFTDGLAGSSTMRQPALSMRKQEWPSQVMFMVYSSGFVSSAEGSAFFFFLPSFGSFFPRRSRPMSFTAANTSDTKIRRDETGRKAPSRSRRSRPSTTKRAERCAGRTPSTSCAPRA